jgi:hypothetical protein
LSLQSGRYIYVPDENLKKRCEGAIHYYAGENQTVKPEWVYAEKSGFVTFDKIAVRQAQSGLDGILDIVKKPVL